MKITLDIPDELTQPQTLSQVDWLQEVAIALFQQELVTMGTASKMAGMHLIQFQRLLSDRTICIHYDIADYSTDIESLKQNNWR